MPKRSRKYDKLHLKVKVCFRIKDFTMIYHNLKLRLEFCSVIQPTINVLSYNEV